MELPSVAVVLSVRIARSVQSIRQEYFHDRTDDATASAHDPRHDDPQHVAEHSEDYVRAVANFSIYHGCSPDKLTAEDVRDYRLHLISRGLKPASINPIMGVLRFFYRTTMS